MTTSAPTARGLPTPELVGLTAGKAVANVSIRWVPFFLPVLGRAFGVSLPAMTTTLGVGEAAGFLTATLGRALDRGAERLVMAAGMGCMAVAAALALVGSFPLFVGAHFLAMLGVSLYTVAGHAYISRHVRFGRRGRAIGIFEVSWALGLFIGAPTAAVLISGLSWRAPFVAVGVLTSVATLALLVWRKRVPINGVEAPTSEAPTVRLNANAWAAVLASAGIALAGLSTIVVLGSWMDDALGVSTSGIGAIAMMFGLIELSSSSTSAAFSDRWGKNRSTRFALSVLLAGLATMTIAGSSVVLGVVAIALFFLGFEYAIVTSFSVVSEAMPSARGRVLSANMAAGTLARGTGSIGSGVLYEWFGITGSAGLAAVGAVLAIGFLSVVD